MLTVGYTKPKKLLKDTVQKRITPKSAFLQSVQRKQNNAARCAKERLARADKAGKVTVMRFK